MSDEPRKLLPTGDDERADQTALAVAVGGVICPVPFVMSAVAIRTARSIPAERRSRRARVAVVVGVLTILAQAALIVLLVAGVL